MSADKTISSSSNPLVREWLDLHTSKGIRKHSQFLIAGERAVVETLQRFPSLARSLIVCADRHLASPLIARARSLATEPKFSVVAVTKAIFDELDISGTHQPLLLAHTPEIPEANLSELPKGLEILCALGDPSNVGALLRSAAAFGASKIIFLRESASPFHPKATRAASAATLLTPLARGPSIKEIEGAVIALDMQGTSLASFSWPKNARLLIGEEGQGVPSRKTFTYVSIPMQNNVESLNATVAASVALYSYRVSQT